MLKIYGNKESLWQWDTNQKLIVNALCDEVHFSNAISVEALVCYVYDLDGLRLVNIPNILLQEDFDINVYVYDVEGKCTEGRELIKVNKRSKPADYVYTETEVKRYETLETRISELEKESGKGGADWEAWEHQNGYIANKPAIRKSNGYDSISVANGWAKGEASLAIGNHDIDSVIHAMEGFDFYNYLQTPETNADLSLSFGVSTNTYGIGSIAMGAATTSGCKGFYWYYIYEDSNRIALSKIQRGNGNRKWDSECATQLSRWKIGDVINLTVNTKYTLCCKITSVDTSNGVILVDKLPFTSVSYPTITMYDDYAVINPSRVDAGVVSFGIFSLASGGNNSTCGNFSQAFGFDNQTVNDFAFVEGRENIAGYAAHAEGMNTEALGLVSHAEGYKNKAIGNYSHAEGYNTQATNDYTHAEGNSTIASGRMAHAEGNNTKATGYASHAEGDGTLASASEAHAEGGGCVASAYCSHAEGAHTIASASYQHTQGKFNKEDASKVHIVGWGSSDTARANIHTIDTSGNGWFKGSVEAAAIILTSPNGTKYKLTINNDGSLNTTKA